MFRLLKTASDDPDRSLSTPSSDRAGRHSTYDCFFGRIDEAVVFCFGKPLKSVRHQLKSCAIKNLNVVLRVDQISRPLPGDGW
jgi:hypothetical protein